jgi:flavin reductase (DIM6/NTAB) family NADH-FMN oxidoreductase RutF
MLHLTDPIDEPAALRRAFGCFPSGVAALCAMDGGSPVGMAASTFTGVSLDPPLVSVCVQLTSSTWPRLRRLGRIGVSVLAEGHEAACLSLSKKDGDRFADVAWSVTGGGAVVIEGASLWLECDLAREVEAGDHAIALLQVVSARVEPGVAPLVFHGSRFRFLAPTQAGERPSDRVGR